MKKGSKLNFSDNSISKLVWYSFNLFSLHVLILIIHVPPAVTQCFLKYLSLFKREICSTFTILNHKISTCLCDMSSEIREASYLKYWLPKTSMFSFQISIPVLNEWPFQAYSLRIKLKLMLNESVYVWIHISVSKRFARQRLRTVSQLSLLELGGKHYKVLKLACTAEPVQSP